MAGFYPRQADVENIRRRPGAVQSRGDRAWQLNEQQGVYGRGVATGLQARAGIVAAKLSHPQLSNKEIAQQFGGNCCANTVPAHCVLQDDAVSNLPVRCCALWCLCVWCCDVSAAAARVPVRVRLSGEQSGVAGVAGMSITR